MNASTNAGRVATSLPGDWRAHARPEWLAHWRVERVAVAGGEIEAVECGAGPPLVLLPPLPGWKESYVALLPLLARRHRVLTFDLRSDFGGAPSWDALVDDVEAIATGRFGVEPVAVLGHSLGGALALRWAIARPARVRALIVSSAFARVFTPRGAGVTRWIEQPLALAAMRWLPEPWSAAAARRLARGRRWVFDAHCDALAIEMVRLGVRRVPVSLIRQRIALAFRHDLRATLHQVTCPALVIHGEHDTLFAIASAEELARGIPGAERAVVDGAGHLHPLSRPDALAALAEGWLARQRAASDIMQRHA